ncbi:hypothetical protein RF11_01467 [Thelohanellus kitauei]|uniref:Uncharacterized protein n=1 Tax=Thelohanellus kitauei TaxID=669202 RepID=A0A0C2MAG0_THEKT|nr:hypothetical protein RF11_01467 [Thelohanellus kitauei]
MFFHFDNKNFNRAEERRVRWKVYYHAAILLQHGLDPIGFVEPHVVHDENTFVHTIGQEMFKRLHEVSKRMCPGSSISETDLFYFIESRSIEIAPTDGDDYYQNMLKYNRRRYLREEISEKMND